MATTTIPFGELEFVKLKIPTLIPRELIEAVKGRTFTPERFYQYMTANSGNPNCFLFCLIDKSKKIHGYLWAEKNALDDALFINTFSVAKEYWGKGEAIPRVVEFLDKLRESAKASRVFWCTTNERFFKKKGFSRSKIVLMEYNKDDGPDEG